MTTKLDWQEWTEDAPPPENERLLWAFPIGNGWRTGVGYHYARTGGHRKGAGVPLPMVGTQWERRVFWTRFDMPEVTP